MGPDEIMYWTEDEPVDGGVGDESQTFRVSSCLGVDPYLSIPSPPVDSDGLGVKGVYGLLLPIGVSHRWVPVSYFLKPIFV